MKINKIDSALNFNLLDLEDPKGVQGGSHVSKIKFDKDDFFIKTDRCISRNGIVTNGRKRYIDVMFSSSDNTFVEWVEKLEESLQKKIYEKSGEWFENELNQDDIENSFLASLKPFRSGKFYLLRCNLTPISELTGSGVKIYDEEGKDLNADDVKENKKMICIININEIRFSSKNFQIDYFVKQIMILNDVNINNEKLLLLGDETENDNILPTTTKKEQQIDNKTEQINDNYCNDDINELTQKDKTCDNTLKYEDIIENAVIKDCANVLGESDNQDKIITVDINNIELNDLVDVSNDELINSIAKPERDIEESIYIDDKKSLEENIKTTIVENPHVNENNHKDIGSLEDRELSLEDRELSLEDCEVNFDFTSTDKKEEIKLKDPKDVYIEIYKAARKKAKETREKAAQAFLDANNIKNKYNLTDIFDSDEDEEEESYLSNF